MCTLPENSCGVEVIAPVFVSGYHDLSIQERDVCNVSVY